MKELWTLFTVFARIGGLTFGGGYAMLPIMQKEIVDTRKWATNEEVLNYYAIGQCTPGIIAINTATFIGYKRKGLVGGVVATLGMAFPSVVIITLIANFSRYFYGNLYVEKALYGIRIGVVALLANTVIKLCKQNVKNKIGVFIFAGGFLFVTLTNYSPVYIIIVAALVGIVIEKRKGKGE